MAFLPDYWWPTDADTVITQEGSQLLRRYGSYSARVQAPNAVFAGDPDNVDSSGVAAPILPVLGSGIVSSPTAVDPTEEKPWFTDQITAWIVQGAIRLEIWDVTDCANVIIWPPRESDLRAVSTETGVWIDILATNPGEDFFLGATTGRITTHVQVALLADVLNTEFYIDAAMLINSPDPAETYFDGRASNILLLAGNEELGIYKNPIASYELDVLDLTRRNTTIWPSEKIEIGASPRLKVDEFTLDTSTARLFNVTRDLTKEAVTSVQVVNTPRPMTMTRLLNMTKRKRRKLSRPHPEQTNRPSNVTNATAIVGNTRLEVKWAPAVGAARYEVREQGPGNTPLERFQNGTPLGPRVDSTRFVFTDSSGTSNRDFQLSIRAYNRAGVASPEPTEVVASSSADAEGARIPTDINCVMYISMDERYDQNGDLLDPQVLPDGTIPVADPGTEERRRRMRFDQGREENHMIVTTDINAPFINGGATTTHAFSAKGGPSNYHIVLGDTDLGTDAGRASNDYSGIAMLVDRRTGGATGGQTGVDFLENFSLCGWVNMCLIWQKGWTADSDGGHRDILWCRNGRYDLTPSGSRETGWCLYLGGPPWWGNNTANTEIHRADGVNGFGFIYLPNRNNGIGDDEDLEDNGTVCFWPYEYAQGLDNVANPPADKGKYCGWLFFCMTASAASGGDMTFEMWVGQADADNLVSLGPIVNSQLRTNMWSPPSEGTPARAQDLMVSISATDLNVLNDDSDYEDQFVLSHFPKFDEMRIYDRQLTPAEILGLYNHPGGQKRTENLLEPERQVQQP